MFETDRLPSGWLPRLLAMDEIWVPSRFTADIFAKAGLPRERLRLLGEAVDVDFFSPEAASAAEAAAASESGSDVGSASLPARRTGCVEGEHGASADCPFRFIAVGKWERRKNWAALIYSFLAEFCPRGVCAEHVELHILTSQYHSDEPLAKAIAELAGTRLRCAAGGGAPGAELPPPHCLSQVAADAAATALRSGSGAIRLWHSVPQALLPRFYASADAFVLASRGEGWGRPHAEAMAMGLPVLATNWSGTTEFLTSKNGFPLRVARLAPIPDGAFAGHLQAEVDLDDLRDTMRAVATTAQADAAARGRRARRDMVRRFSPAVLATRLAELAAEALHAPKVPIATPRSEL